MLTAEEHYYSELDLCGCGNPEAVYELIHNILTSRQNVLLDFDKVQEYLQSDPEITAQLVLHFLSSKGYIEHGSSVRGSWLTDKGEQFVNLQIPEEL